MKLKITPEMEASMRATESRLDTADDGNFFKAELIMQLPKTED